MTAKEAGYKLYQEGVDLDEIAKILKRSYNTIAKWSSDGDWKKRKIDQTLREETSKDRVWGLIDYQLRIVERICKQREKELNDDMSAKELRSLLIDKGEIDALAKLFAPIKGKEMTWDNIVKNTRELVTHIESYDLNLAKQVIPIIHEWLNKKREDMV